MEATGQQRRQERSAPTERHKSAVRAVRDYISRINAADPAGIVRRSSERLRFIDATGAVHRLGKRAWAGYFADFPDYQIQVDRVFSRGSTVAVFGIASGSYKGRGATIRGAAWRVPAAWRAVVRAGKVVEWQVYLDVEPMLRSAGSGRFS